MEIPVNEPIITDEAKAYVAQALATGWGSSQGEFIDRFEAAFEEFLGVKHAVMTTSGTAALHVCLAALGIGPGDEVIVPDFTMIASVFSILYCGAVPVLVDVEPETFTIDPKLIESRITGRTKAIMPVHIYGHPCDMDPILTLAGKHGLHVVEDAAEAHGARYKGRMCGAMGGINAFSFYGNKIVTTGEGGMVVTDDDALADLARSLKDLSHRPGRRFTHDRVGFNYRPTNMQGALGLGQIAHVEEFLAKKRWMARVYEERLGGIPGLRLPVTKTYAENVYWMYAVLVEEKLGMSRDAFREELRKRGIDTRDFFASSASQPALRGYVRKGEAFPVSADIAARGLYLPSGLALTEAQIDYVCATIRSIAA